MWGFLNFLRNRNSLSNIRLLNASTFKEHIENDHCTVLDVRTPNEFSRGHIKKAINSNLLDKEEFLKKLKGLHKKSLFIYTANREIVVG